PQSGSSCQSGTNGSAASEPQVPGALGRVPVPKPKARKCQGLRHTDGGTAACSVTRSPEVLIATLGWQARFALLIMQMNALPGFHPTDHGDVRETGLQFRQFGRRQGEGQTVVIAAGKRAAQRLL